jgi:hypothetical protein
VGLGTDKWHSLRVPFEWAGRLVAADGLEGSGRGGDVSEDAKWQSECHLRWLVALAWRTASKHPGGESTSWRAPNGNRGECHLGSDTDLSHPGTPTRARHCEAR